MTRKKQIYEDRFYEGEHAFGCGCGGEMVIYAYEDEDLSFLQTPPRCYKCGNIMGWKGWSGQSDISHGIRDLIRDGHAIAAIVILAAFVEYQIDNLLWAILVDSGLPKKKASDIANGTLPRGDAIRMVRSLLERKIKNVVFPVRNAVAHGRAFGWEVQEYIEALDNQFNAIEKWINSIKKGNIIPGGCEYTELDRWILSMSHWLSWQKEWWNKLKTNNKIASSDTKKPHR